MTKSCEEVMKIQTLSRFETLGDNCELGLLQRSYGVEYSNLFRWSYSFSVQNVINILDRRFDGLFKFENLTPREGGDMVNDVANNIAFHSDMRSTLEGARWTFVNTDEERRKIYSSEEKKIAYLTDKTVKCFAAGEKIFVYKQNRGTTDDEADALLQVLRRYGPVKLLVLNVGFDRNPSGSVEKISDGFYKGYIDRFAPYNRADQASAASLLTVLTQTVQLDGTLDKSRRISARPSPCEIAEQVIEDGGASLSAVPAEIDIGNYGARHPDLAVIAHDRVRVLQHYLEWGYFEGRVWQTPDDNVTNYSSKLDILDFFFRTGRTQRAQEFLSENVDELSSYYRVFLIALKVNALPGILVTCYNALSQRESFPAFKLKVGWWLRDFYSRAVHSDFIGFIAEQKASGQLENWNQANLRKAVENHSLAMPPSIILSDLAVSLDLVDDRQAAALDLVSLGVNCEVAHNIKLWRQHLVDSGNNASTHELQSDGSQFFDWNICTLRSVIDCIRTDFSNVFMRENIKVRDEKVGTFNYVDDEGSGIRFHHTFSRINDITTEDIVAREYDEKYEKTQYLVGKFKGLYAARGFIFYLRRGDESLDELYQLVDALHARRENRQFVVVAIISRPPPTVHHSYMNNLLIVEMPYCGIWSGDPDRWMDLFARLSAMFNVYCDSSKISIFSNIAPAIATNEQNTQRSRIEVG
jgi:hypothetical protein